MRLEGLAHDREIIHINDLFVILKIEDVHLFIAFSYNVNNLNLEVIHIFFFNMALLKCHINVFTKRVIHWCSYSKYDIKSICYFILIFPISPRISITFNNS